MQLSKHNIISKVSDSDQYFIVNPLSGHADILDEDHYQKIKAGDINNPELIEKGYVVDSKAEATDFRSKYLQFIDDREEDEVQLFFVTNYSCNFDCSYCYQAGYTEAPKQLNTEIIDAFFEYVDAEFKDRRKYITIFGGEPFLNTPKQKENITYIIQQAKLRKLEIAAVTNGYHIDKYINILKEGLVREIQVTLDGTKHIHDKRRYLKGEGSTFDEIVSGVDGLLSNNIPVNLRMVVDKDNIENLPDLAQFAINRGWTNSTLFKTQLGRNYELHECQANQGKLYSRLSLYQDLYRLLKDHPHISEFHAPAFSISKFLFEQGEMPAPLFDACTGTKTEWAFDYTGNFYACTATVGKEGESLGTFFPKVEKYTSEIEEWTDRDILSIPKCKSCELSLICGGGCASMAKNYNGELNSHDCRPVKELLELGISNYFEL